MGVQLFKKEEQNFVFANEIDNMALIMPSQDKHAAVAAPIQALWYLFTYLKVQVMHVKWFCLLLVKVKVQIIVFIHHSMVAATQQKSNKKIQ